MWFTRNLSISINVLENLPKSMHYGFIDSQFGRILLGVSAPEDDANLGFIYLLYFVQKDDSSSIAKIGEHWPKVKLQRDDVLIEKWRQKLFSEDKENHQIIEVAVHGTEFQVKVWKALTNVETGCTYSYAQLAEMVDRPKAVRAVATTVGRNEVSILIPCHRIVSQNGQLKYGWGGQLKKQLLDFEANLG
ncbi:bifunctional transcriptional activator/DNA repair enzyme Ada [Drosophila tropicalis]|uniref:bifunctional transcriptional activator/DNA repair enzyme Ada n=1 Tax=Drosophila tropicalis TaxID=46794 RepID=UPI0035AB9504